MSYILEALKKSDKERRRDEIPDLQADHSLPPVRRRERKPLSRLLPGAAILIICGAVALLGWQWISAQKTLSVAETVAPVEEVQFPVKSPVLSPEIKKQISKEVTAAVAQAATEPVPSSDAVLEKKSVPVKSETVLPSSQKKSTEPVTPLLDELPLAIRAGIPDLTFAGHVYSESGPKRLIIINNRIVREGDLIANGLSLEQIEPDGVILRYEDAVFRVTLF